jgi:Tfp pilus assembly protein PilE
MRSRRSTIRRGGFTFIDLLMVVVLVLLVSAVLPAISRSTRHSANRVECGSNLRQIGQAMLLYANDNNGQFPRTTHDPTAPTPRAYTGAMAPNPFSADGPKPNDVTAALFLRLSTQDITTAVFVCPSTVAEPLDVFRGSRTERGSAPVVPPCSPVNCSWPASLR